jgi:valyl-tRNA synthetase
MRLLHPFTPYVTEEIWQHLRQACLAEPNRPTPPEGWADALIIAHWPDTSDQQPTTNNDFPHIMDIVRAIRNGRAENKVELGRKIAATIVAWDKEPLVNSQRETIARLASLEPTQFRIFARLPERPQQAVTLVVGTTEIYLPLAGMVDAEAERGRLQKELDTLDKQIAKLETLLGSDFVNKAPPAVIEKERGRLTEAKESRAKLAERLGS